MAERVPSQWGELIDVPPCRRCAMGIQNGTLPFHPDEPEPESPEEARRRGRRREGKWASRCRAIREVARLWSDAPELADRPDWHWEASATELERVRGALCLLAEGAEKLREVGVGLRVDDDWHTLIKAALMDSRRFAAMSRKAEVLPLLPPREWTVGEPFYGDHYDHRIAAWLTKLKPEITGTLATLWAIAVEIEEPVSFDPRSAENAAYVRELERKGKHDVDSDDPAIPTLVFRKRVERWQKAINGAKKQAPRSDELRGRRTR